MQAPALGLRLPSAVPRRRRYGEVLGVVGGGGGRARSRLGARGGRGRARPKVARVGVWGGRLWWVPEGRGPGTYGLLRA